MPNQSNSPEKQQRVGMKEQRDLTRRDAVTAIARFSAYIAPATYVLLDSKSAFAQACSGGSNGNGNGNGNSGNAPGHGGTPPGQGGTPPGQC